jgi:hypothetical protein
MPSGGRFPSAEEPDLLSRDIAAFLNDLRSEPVPTRPLSWTWRTCLGHAPSADLPHRPATSPERRA